MSLPVTTEGDISCTFTRSHSRPDAFARPPAAHPTMLSSCGQFIVPALPPIARPLESGRIAELDSIPGQGPSTLPATCPGAGYRLPCHLHASGQEVRLFAKDSPHWRGNLDPAVWSVRRLYALRVPGALNLNPNAARFTLICCSWMFRASLFLLQASRSCQ
jgi:hypothetical protein